MKRLVCVGEGRGEVEALPRLCARILYSLGVSGWYVDERAIRMSRAKLVDESVPSPMRPPNEKGIDASIALAKARRANAVLVTCDEDDDCAADWGPAATRRIQRQLPGAAVMAVREFETWILHSRADLSSERVERRRDAKGMLDKAIGGYLPSLQQEQLVRSMDLDRVRAVSDSFDKFVRALAGLCGVTAPPRPRLPVR